MGDKSKNRRRGPIPASRSNFQPPLKRINSGRGTHHNDRLGDFSSERYEREEWDEYERQGDMGRHLVGGGSTVTKKSEKLGEKP